MCVVRDPVYITMPSSTCNVCICTRQQWTLNGRVRACLPVYAYLPLSVLCLSECLHVLTLYSLPSAAASPVAPAIITSMYYRCIIVVQHTLSSYSSTLTTCPPRAELSASGTQRCLARRLHPALTVSPPYLLQKWPLLND